jgi:mevalonate kinase
MKKFNAKILLFGEYGLLYGADALAIPFPKFGGTLKFVAETKDEAILNSQKEIQKFVVSFEMSNLNSRMNFFLDLKCWKKELQEGLYFDSDIPVQYGLGSSGALCAAIFDRYSSFIKNNNDLIDNIILQNLKKDFSMLESSFHGRSSGIDPLVSFLNQPVLFTPEKIELPELKNSPGNFSAFLIDTKIKSSTAPLVALFNKKMENPGFNNRFKNDFLPANNKAVQAFLDGNKKEFFRQLEQISTFQSVNFAEMIPESFKDFFRSSAKNNTPVKLLGSGGGGYLLAFAEGKTKIPENIKNLKIKYTLR